MNVIRGWLKMANNVGKEDLCGLREMDVNNEAVINRIKNTSRSTFLSLCNILRKQSDLRQMNITRKLQKGKQSLTSLDMEISQTTQISQGTLPLCVR